MNTKIKNIMIIDGGPRIYMNTGAMIAAFAEGVREGGGETKIVRLYDIDYKGCRSCMACHIKGKCSASCLYVDGLTETLKECVEADGLVLATPIYYGEMTGMMRAFWERLTFPWLDYSKGVLMAPKRMPVSFIYTMNGSPANGEKIRRSSMRSVEMMTDMALSHELGREVEAVMANNTCQVNDYSLYNFADGTAESKQQWHNTHWEDDLRKAREAGKRMIKTEF
ncbi:MAG: flavodoxin family protein [Bacteroidales bacterium]|nr:flavodoxin family protein [Bacteroidales bacterium]